MSQVQGAVRTSPRGAPAWSDALAAARAPPPACLPCATQLKEVQNTLELVQGQRNELRQEVKDLKAALADAQAALQVSPWKGGGIWPALRCARPCCQCAARVHGASRSCARWDLHRCDVCLLHTSPGSRSTQSARTRCCRRVRRPRSSCKRRRMQLQQRRSSWLTRRPLPRCSLNAWRQKRSSSTSS